MNSLSRPNMQSLLQNPHLRFTNKRLSLLDFRSRYACGHVSLAVMRFFESGGNTEHLLNVKYQFTPLGEEDAIKRCAEYFGEGRIQIHPNQDLASLPFLLSCMGDAICLVGAAYDPDKSKKYGFLPRFWGHWFVILHEDYQVFPIDAFSRTDHAKSLCYPQKYLEQFQQNIGCFIIIVPLEEE